MNTDDFTRFGDFKALERTFPDLEDITMTDPTDAAVEALTNESIVKWRSADNQGDLVRFAIRHVLTSRRPGPEDVERLSKDLLDAWVASGPDSDVRQACKHQARAILALYDAPARIPTRSALDSALDPILGNSNARRAVVDAVLGAFGGVADYRVPTEVDLERIASGVWGRSASRGVNVPSWKDLHEAKRLYIRLQVRDTLAYATIKPNAECDLRAANARIATLEAELAAAKSPTIRLGEGLTEAQIEQIGKIVDCDTTGVESDMFTVGGAVLKNRHGDDRFVSTTEVSRLLRNRAQAVRNALRASAAPKLEVVDWVNVAKDRTHTCGRYYSNSEVIDGLCEQLTALRSAAGGSV